MLLITSIVGDANDPVMHHKLHGLESYNRVETVVLARSDLARRRLRARTDRGTDVAIALSRADALSDGAVLALRDDLAIVLRVEAETWLRLRPKDGASALALGYHAGNLHWRVRFDGDLLLVAIETEVERYLARLDAFLSDGRAVVEEAPQRQDLEASA